MFVEEFEMTDGGTGGVVLPPSITLPPLRNVPDIRYIENIGGFSASYSTNLDTQGSLYSTPLVCHPDSRLITTNQCGSY